MAQRSRIGLVLVASLLVGLLLSLTLPAFGQVIPDAEPGAVTTTTTSPAPAWWQPLVGSWLSPEGLTVLLALIPIVWGVVQRRRAGKNAEATELGAKALATVVAGVHGARGKLDPVAAATLVAELRDLAEREGVQPVLRPIVDALAPLPGSSSPPPPSSAIGLAARELKRGTTRHVKAPEPPAAPPPPVL